MKRFFIEKWSAGSIYMRLEFNERFISSTLTE